MIDQVTESAESRLSAAGFTRNAHLWVTPDGTRALGQDAAIAGLDSGEIKPHPGYPFPDVGVRSLPDELVARMFGPSPAPPWLEPLAELIADKLKPAIRAELRKGRSP